MSILLRAHKRIEKHAGLLIFGILIVSSIGGLVQVLPTLFQKSLATPTGKPYTALQLAGRDIYIRESCGLCHTQQIRPFVAEVKRYGDYSRAGEFVYDRPFLWGSKRTGPDLARVGGKFSDEWHRLHLQNPRAVVPDSIMPSYPWLAESPLIDGGWMGTIGARMRGLRALGHPYSDEEIAAAAAALAGKTELDAVVAYLQSLGAGGAEAAR